MLLPNGITLKGCQTLGTAVTEKSKINRNPI